MPDPRALNGSLLQLSTPAAILAFASEHASALNSVNCATALHSLAKQGATASARVRAAGRAHRVRAALGRAPRDARSLTSIAWASAKLQLDDAGLWAAVSASAASLLPSLDAYALANVAWALATVRRVAPEADGALLEALAEAALVRLGEFKPQELCNLLWAFATLKRRHRALFEAASAAAARFCGAGFTAQGLSQTVWAFAKLGLAKHALLVAAAAAAKPRAAQYDPQSLATLAWAFANLEVEHAPLIGAVSAQARARPAAFDGTSCAQLLWALTRLSDGVDAAAVAALVDRLTALAAAGSLSNQQQLLYALGALAKLPPTLGPRLPALLAAAAAATAPALSANKLGIAAWALGRPAVASRLPRAAADAWRAALGVRCAEVSEHLSWRAVGHIEMGLRAIAAAEGGEDDGEAWAARAGGALVRSLGDAAARAVAAANERSRERNSQPAALFVEAAPWRALSKGGAAKVLVAGADDDGVAAALAAAGLAPTAWRRFASSPADAHVAAWPTAAGDGEAYDGCAMRWPWYAAGDAAAMALHAIAPLLKPGAELWVFGNADEGADGCEAALAPLFDDCTLVRSRDGALVYRARRRTGGGGEEAGGACVAAGLAGDGGAALPGGDVPRGDGGGGVGSLPGPLCGRRARRHDRRALPRASGAAAARARVLDFASGSGALAAALLARAPTLRVHLLDADAVAIAAARENVPTAARCFVCAGWPPLTSFKKRKPKRYDLIVSNPPVHAGQPDDFGVLVTMIRGARRRLRKGGSLWFVAQEQVPAGRLLALHGRFAWVKAAPTADGRFVVWSAGGRAEEAEATGAAPKRKPGSARRNFPTRDR